MLASLNALTACFILVVGQSPPSSQPASTQAATPGRKARLAVLEFRVSGKVDASGSGVAAALVRKEFNASGKYDLMDREMMRERMAEKDWAAITECDQVKCMVKYGTSLDVEKIVGGSMASFGDSWLVEIRLVDVNTGREEKTFARRHTGKMDDVLDVVVDGSRELLGLTESKPAEPDRPRGENPTSKALTLDCGNGVTMELVLIPAGSFTIGSNDGASDEKPPHPVTLSRPFYMGKYEVTQAQWQAVMGGNPSHFQGDDKLPVESVSWDDCQEFCKKLSAKSGKAVRLPTEAEWEYACRAGSMGRFCFGDNDGGLGAYAWYTSNSDRKTHPVGQKKSNAWGLYDTHGNVWEWCADWYDKYPGSGATSDFFRQKCRVLRGGGWGNGPFNCRSAYRSWCGPDLRSSLYGLRVALGTQ
jgi:formylglycine-generating enzyme required for sulfatase activity